MVELINSDPAVLDGLVTCDESWIYCYDPELPVDALVTCDESWIYCYDPESPVEACWLSQTQEG